LTCGIVCLLKVVSPGRASPIAAFSVSALCCAEVIA
jgi:hypothetical protein